MRDKLWSLYAPIYKYVVYGDHRYYETMYRRIRKVVYGKRVLEIGTGPGLFAKNIACAAKEVVAVDFSEGMIQEAKKGNIPSNVIFEVADAMKLPYGNATFDIVVISNTLHTISNPDRALAEIYRVLNHRGILIAPNFIHKEKGLSTWFFTRVLLLSGVKFYNLWSETEYLRMLADNGFCVVNAKKLPLRIKMLYTENVKIAESE